MSRTTSSKSAVTIEAPSNADLAEQSITREPDGSSERQAFYREYRHALKEYLAGRPERFEAFQNDPRIKPPPESCRAHAKTLTTAESASIVTAERISLMTDAKVALISLMASVRSLSTTIGSLFN